MNQQNQPVAMPQGQIFVDPMTGQQRMDPMTNQPLMMFPLLDYYGKQSTYKGMPLWRHPVLDAMGNPTKD